MKNLKEFIASKKIVKMDKNYTYENCARLKDVTVYDDCPCIANMEDGTYFLEIERSEFESKEISVLEEVLFDWYKWELKIEKDDMIKDINDRVIELIGHEVDLINNDFSEFPEEKRYKLLYFSNELIEINEFL